jgi:hypothetical protein
MAVSTTTSLSGIGLDHAVPTLENCDRLTGAEFERRYEAMPQLKKAELIEGVVYVPLARSCATRSRTRRISVPSRTI